MGVVIRQGIRHSIVNYIGAGVGVISMLFIYPLQTEAYGLARFLADSVILFIPFSLLGSNVLPVRFFPHFEDRANGHQGFLGWLLLLALAGALLTLAVAWMVWDPVLEYYSTVSPLYEQYLVFFLPILLLRGVIQLLVTYISNFHRIVVPSILNDLLFKISLPMFILFLHKGWWGYRELVIALVAHFAVVLAGLILYLIQLGQWSLRIRWQAFRGPVMKEMKVYGIYGFLGTISSTLAVNIDLFMIGTMISPGATGVYGIASIMANLINRPHIAISLLAAPLLTKSWKEQDLAGIHNFYRKSAVNALAPGLLIFLLIWLNLDDLYGIMPNSAVIAENRMAILLLGLAFFVNLATGVNSEIMIYTDLYRRHLVAVVLLSLVNIGLNFWLISLYGITGAALATLVAYGAYNAYKGIAVWRRFHMHPFTAGLGRLVLYATALAMVVSAFDLDTGSPWINLILRSAMTGAGFVVIGLYGRISEDIPPLIRALARPFTGPGR